MICVFFGIVSFSGLCMAFKRKRGGRRMLRRRPRKAFRPRRARPAKGPVSINKHAISYTREVPLNNLVITTGNNKVFFGYSFGLDQLPNYQEFSALFDQFRIRRVMMKFRLVQPPEASNTPATSQFFPDIYTTVDHDDASVPGDIDTVLSYGKCKRGILKPNYWFRYACYPTCAMQLYRTGTTTAYAPMKNGAWIDLGYPNTPYYAVKGAISNEAAGVTSAPLNIEVHLVMTVQFKNTR